MQLLECLDAAIEYAYSLEDEVKQLKRMLELVGLPQPAVSRHLAYLRRSGLVEVTRDWKLGRYRLAEPRDPVHRSLIECVRSCFTGVPSMDAERRRAELRAAERDALRPARARAAPRRRRTLTTGFSPTG